MPGQWKSRTPHDNQPYWWLGNWQQWPVRPEVYLTHKQCRGSPVQGSHHCIFCISRDTITVDKECSRCWSQSDQSHHNNQPLYQRLALVGKKSSSDVRFHVQLMSERVEDVRHKPCTTADLRCLVMQEQMPNMTPNAKINVIRPLNTSKRQCHLTIMMTVIAIIIVMCQHMRNLLPHYNWIDCNKQV